MPSPSPNRRPRSDAARKPTTNSSRDVRLPDSHLAVVNLKENGVGLKIVRRSLPFGKITANTV
ncbi:dyp-type peroxidase family protein [Neisseria gonorrhoeae]|nr:dyp-type peroxidase family protein [Neisseria gonorrhoeae]